MSTPSRRNSKGYSGASSENGGKGREETASEFSINATVISAPKYGTIVPERVFVGGISMSMNESELTDFFSKYGKVIDTKIIVDRAGVSKGYGFITFETEEEAKKLLADADNIMLRERKLNIAPAIKKQSFNQRLDVASGAASMVGTPLFGAASLPFTFHNGMTYFCSHNNGTGAMTAPQPPAPQPPPPQPPPPTTPASHLDPNIYTGYGGIQTAAPQYHQVLYNTPIYYQAAQYQYPITTCEAVEGSMNDGNALQGGPLSTGSPALGQVMISPNGYYLQDLTPYQEYAYPPPYVYQSAPEAQPQVGAHHTAVIQYSPAAPPQPPQPRPLYDSPVMLPESARGEVRMSAAVPPKIPQLFDHSPPRLAPVPTQPPHQGQPQLHRLSAPQGQHRQLVQPQPHPGPQAQHQQHRPVHRPAHKSPPVSSSHSPNVANKPKENTNAVTSSRPAVSKSYDSQYPHPPDTNNNNRSMSPRHHTNQYRPNPIPLVSQVFPAPQNAYSRPPSGSNTSSYPPHYSNNHFSDNSTGTFFKKFRKPYNPSVKGRGGGRGGGGGGGGSVSSYSSGGGGGGLVTPPSTPRSSQPSPDHQSSQTVSASTPEHLVHSMKTLKAA